MKVKLEAPEGKLFKADITSGRRLIHNGLGRQLGIGLYYTRHTPLGCSAIIAQPKACVAQIKQPIRIKG